MVLQRLTKPHQRTCGTLPARWHNCLWQWERRWVRGAIAPIDRQAPHHIESNAARTWRREVIEEPCAVLRGSERGMKEGQYVQDRKEQSLGLYRQLHWEATGQLHKDVLKATRWLLLKKGVRRFRQHSCKGAPYCRRRRWGNCRTQYWLVQRIV